jgi:hypothetical protein
VCIIGNYCFYRERQNVEATPKERNSLILQNSLRNNREKRDMQNFEQPKPGGEECCEKI